PPAARHPRLSTQLAHATDLPCDPGDLGRERVQLVDHHVDGVFQLQDLAMNLNRDLFREVAFGYRGGHLRDVAHLRGEVSRHVVDVVCQLLPDARHLAHVGLTAELALGPDLPCHPAYF